MHLVRREKAGYISIQSQLFFRTAAKAGETNRAPVADIAHINGSHLERKAYLRRWQAREWTFIYYIRTESRKIPSTRGVEGRFLSRKWSRYIWVLARAASQWWKFRGAVRICHFYRAIKVKSTPSLERSRNTRRIRRDRGANISFTS